MSPVLHVLALGLIGVGVLFRLLMATYGQPFVSDEVGVVDHALRLFADGPNPHWFLYPSLHLYAVAASEGALFGARWILGLSPTPDAFADWYFTDPRGVYVAARVWSVVAGSATLWVVYQLGVRLASPLVGLWAAVFLAVSPMHIYYSAIAKPDACMVLAMQVAGWLAVRFVQGEGRGLPWGVAVLGGLGATIKYPGGAAWFAAPVAMALRLHQGRPNVWTLLKNSMLLAVAAVLTFFSGTPFALVEPELVKRDLGGIFQTAQQGYPGMEGITTWGMYLGDALPHALSFAILALAALGLVGLIVSDWRSTVVAVTPAAAYAVPTFAATLAQFGFVLPLLPTICLCAGKGFEVMRSPLPWSAGQRLAVPGVLILAFVSTPFLTSLCDQVRVQRLTTQDVTAEWIREHVPPGARILGTATGISLPLTSERLSELLAEATSDRPAGGARIRFLQRMSSPGSGYFFYDMQGYVPKSKTGIPQLMEYDPEWITAHGFQYVVESEWKMKRFFRAPERYPLPFRFQRWLADKGELVFTTHPGSRGWVDWRDNPMRLREIEPWCGVSGGEFRIYRIK